MPPTSSTRRPPRCAGVLCDARGSVFVEALVYIPFLLVVWVALGDVHRVGRARFSAHAQARACAWSFASTGEDAPDGARCSVRERADADADAGLTAGAAWSRLRAAIPELQTALPGLLGAPFDSERAGAVDRPPTFGGPLAIRAELAGARNPGGDDIALREVLSWVCRRTGAGACAEATP